MTLNVSNNSRIVFLEMLRKFEKTPNNKRNLVHYNLKSLMRTFISKKCIFEFRGVYIVFKYLLFAYLST